MSWVKHRDKLHEAALSSIKSISKIKTLTSKNGIPQRPPSFNQAILTSAPRSTKDLPSWRGEADFQAFWYLFHKTKPDVNLNMPARIVYNELEIAHDKQEQEACLYSVTQSELSNVRVLNKQGEYVDLQGAACTPLSQEQLAQLVTTYLLNEGQCCLGKIKTLNTKQAFDLLGL